MFARRVARNVYSLNGWKNRTLLADRLHTLLLTKMYTHRIINQHLNLTLTWVHVSNAETKAISQMLVLRQVILILILDHIHLLEAHCLEVVRQVVEAEEGVKQKRME